VSLLFLSPSARGVSRELRLLLNRRLDGQALDAGSAEKPAMPSV
jgi:hypothetical protein